MMKKNDEVDTRIDIRVYKDNEFIGLSAKMSNGRWETHPAPVESGPWTYHDSADEAVECLTRFS